MTTVVETLPDYFFFLEHTKVVKPGTLLTYKQTLTLLCQLYGMKQTTELSPTHIRRWKKHLMTKKCQKKNQRWMSDSTVASHIVRLKSYLRWLGDKWLLKNVSAADIPMKREILRNPTYLTKTELKKLFAALEEQLKEDGMRKKAPLLYSSLMLRAIIHLLYATGLRNAEIRLLKTNDIDLQQMRGTIIGKGGKYNNFTFHAHAKKMLTAFLDFKKRLFSHKKYTSEYLFTGMYRASPLTATGLNSALRKIGEKAGIEKKLHAHVFRHTCATHLLDNGAHIREVQEKLRHVNLETTALYTHVSNGRLAELTQGLMVD